MNGGHPLRFSTEDFTSYDYSEGRELTGAPLFYTTGVTIETGEGGKEQTVTIVVDENTPDLFYICKFHPNMGKEATVEELPRPLDYETSSSHTIEVQATSTDGSISFESFVISVTDDAWTIHHLISHT